MNDYFNDTIDNIDRILQSTKAKQKEFLSRYLDEYGTFENDVLKIHVDDSNVCKQLQILLLTFGVISNRLENELIIDKEYLANIKVYIGFNKRELQLALERITEYIMPITDSFIELPVINIIEEDEEEVYSIKVDSECHSFTANGFINHNTEAKLTKLAETTLDGVNANAVEMVPNYSETTYEPVVLPGAFPALLCNGTYGIAVGYSSYIPSHQLGEVVDGIIAYIKNNDITIDELMKIIPGPDFPTGGLLINNAEISKLYHTGKASLSFRAKYHLEDNEIVIDELPPRINKIKLIEKLRDLCLISKKIPGVTAVNDLSTINTKIVLRLAKTAITDLIVKSIFEQTELAVNISYIMRGVYNNQPVLFSLKDAIQYYVNHRRNCLSRENIAKLEKTEQKRHMLQGLVALTNNLKKAISIIENADNDNIAKDELKKTFKLDDVQADAILEVKLRRLTKLNRNDLLNSIKNLDNDIVLFTSRKDDIKLIDQLIVDQCNDLKKQFNDVRKTEIINDCSNEVVHDVILFLTNKNTIKLFSNEAYEELVRQGNFKEKNEICIKKINAKSDSLFLLILENGEYIRLTFNEVLSWNEKTKIVDIYALDDINDNDIIVLTAKGLIQKIKVSGFKSRVGKSSIIFNNWDNDKIIFSRLTTLDNNNVISIITFNGLLHRFQEASLKETLSTGKNGVNAINLKDDYIVSANISDESDKYIILYTKHENSYGYKLMLSENFTVKARNGKGISSITFSKKNPGTIFNMVVTNNDFINIDNKGRLQLVKIDNLNIGSRTSKPENIDYDLLQVNFHN